MSDVMIPRSAIRLQWATVLALVGMMATVSGFGAKLVAQVATTLEQVQALRQDNIDQDHDIALLVVTIADLGKAVARLTGTSEERRVELDRIQRQLEEITQRTPTR